MLIAFIIFLLCFRFIFLFCGVLLISLSSLKRNLWKIIEKIVKKERKEGRKNERQNERRKEICQ